MNLRDTLLRARDDLTSRLTELDAARSRIVKEIAVVEESLAKLEADAPGAEETCGTGEQPKRKRRENSGIVRTRKLLEDYPEGLTAPEIAQKLNLQTAHASNIISHLNNVDKVLVPKGKRDGKNAWALAVT